MYHLLLAALLGGVSHAAEPRFGLDDVYRIAGFSSPRISPDGTQVLFVRSKVDLEHDRRNNALIVLDLRTRAQHVLSDERTVHAAMWSPDGSSIAFISDDATHHAQVWTISPQGGAPQRVTSAPEGVDEYAWRPDGKAIAFISGDSLPKRTGIARWQDAFRVTDNAYLDPGPFPNSHLYLTTLDDRRTRRLTHGAWSVAAGDAASTLSWSPDGKRLTFVRLPNALLGDAEQSVVETIDVASGAIHALSGRTRYEFNPRFSPDGKHLAYIYARAGDPMNEADIFVSPGRGAGTDLTLHSLDVNATNFAWYPDSRALLVGAPAQTTNALWRVGLDGHVQRIELGSLNAAGSFDGSIARDGAIAFIGSSAHHPEEIYYRSASGRITRLTNDNDAIASMALGRVATLNWRGRDGFHEDGVLTYPVGYAPGKRYPLVLLIHGGPTGTSTTSFDQLGQLMAARGWFVLQPNYRGSDNMGNAYQHAIYIDATKGPGEDILAGVSAAERALPIDPRSISVSGWSYGGMMTSWLITQDHRWACAVSGAAVNDLVYDYALADDISSDRESMPGSPFTANRMHFYHAVSPMTYYRNVTTPTLILSDMYDVRVPAAQSYVFYHALRDNGTPVAFYEWPVHGHFPSDPVRIVDVYRYWMGWIATHVKRS
jgi:dipeptidyl aminopeptidase/acylaminoacyl peptidase